MLPNPRRKTQQLVPEQRYNIRVPMPDIHVPSAKQQAEAHKHHRHAVYASEATGLLLIAFLLLVLTVIRYWHNLHWSWR